jgi:ABC-type protease/lipase transport system fused ATPase/permease subunit
MDKLLLLRDGEVAEFGRRDRVLANLGRDLKISEIRPAAAAVGVQVG